MEYVIIKVPDMNDSISRVVLNRKFYRIRFTYSLACDYWTFGVYTDQDDPIAIGIKIVPNMALNLFFGYEQLPNGQFVCMSSQDRVGRDDFKEEKATFAFFPMPEANG